MKFEKLIRTEYKQTHLVRLAAQGGPKTHRLSHHLPNLRRVVLAGRRNDAALVQDSVHGELSGPLEALAKVARLGRELGVQCGAGAVLVPFVLPQRILGRSAVDVGPELDKRRAQVLQLVRVESPTAVAEKWAQTASAVRP